MPGRGSGLPSATAGGLPSVARPWTLGGRVLAAPFWADTAAVSLLLAVVALVHWPSISGVALYARSDTLTFFYPVFAALQSALRDGELPLWSPRIFGGFPLFSEGQIGALYPPAWLVVRLASPIDGFLALRVFHVSLAVIGPYVFARTLGVSPLGGCMAGLVFGLGSFVVGQQHHANLLAATVWMPIVLACVQAALARRGWLGFGLLGLGGLALGVEALATHVQPLMLMAAMLVSFVLWRQGAQAVAAVREAPSARAGWAGVGAALGWAVLALTLVPLIGALIGAGQLLPLLELSQESWRARGFSYQDATEYSLPPTNLVTLIFPFFFRVGDAGQWSLWQAWEVVLYVGIAPLFLAATAIVAVRRWPVPYFSLVTLVAGVVSLGGYAPYGLYAALLQIPGMSVQRAPARLSMLVTLAVGILAAFGVDWLARRGAWKDGDRHPRRALVILQLAALGTLGVLVFHLAAWRAWLQAERTWALEVAGRTYLRMTQDPLQGLAPLDVVRGLDSALDLANPKTALSLGLLAALATLLLAWRELPRLAGLWRGLLVLLVAVDLVIFGVDFHPLVRADEIAALDPAAEFLAARAGQGRSLTHPDAEPTRPNRLLSAGVEEATGYSPLQLERHRWYAGAVGTVDNSLLDLWGVRWVVEPRTSSSLPSYQQVAYHPVRPLMVGGVGTPNGQVAFDVAALPATELRTVLALRDGATIEDGELVGEWLVTDDRGVRTILPIRAGREVADERLGTPGVGVAHRPAMVAGRLSDGEGQPARVLSYAALALPSRATVTRVEYRHQNPTGQSAVYGLTLHDAQTDRFEQVTRQAKYALAYRDAAVTIYENRAAFPRAFVVTEPIWVADGSAAQSRLVAGPFDPRRQVVIEGEGPPGELRTRAPAEPVPAVVADDGWRAVTVDATAPDGGYLVLTDPFFPGWRAFVDGAEVPIWRADYLFRAVELPPGDHRVWFIFDPPSLRLGLELSRAGLALGLSTLALALLGPLLGRRLRGRGSAA